jgi:hypothetical protein
VFGGFISRVRLAASNLASLLRLTKQIQSFRTHEGRGKRTLYDGKKPPLTIVHVGDSYSAGNGARDKFGFRTMREFVAVVVAQPIGGSFLRIHCKMFLLTRTSTEHVLMLSLAIFLTRRNNI